MILCCGEALIDMIPRPTVEGSTGFVPHAGGAVFNTAIALGRLGAKAGLLSDRSSKSTASLRIVGPSIARVCALFRASLFGICRLISM